MNPDSKRPTTPVVPPREGLAPIVPSRSPINQSQQQTAAQNVIRSQIDSHFDSHPQTIPQESPILDSTDLEAQHTAYQHTHSTAEKTTQNNWQQYHSAWQQYYQQYYERYYVGAVYKTQTELTEHARQLHDAAEINDREQDNSLDTNEALYDIRSRLRRQINTRAKKVRGSRHFVPVILAISVMLTFGFLQYNSLILGTVAAYVSPGNASPANIIVNPNIDQNVGPDPELIIPKINVDAPIDFNTDATSYSSLMDAMKKGVAYFGIQGANARPGQVGNFGLSGHSSNDLFDTGGYKFIFVNLTRLQEGDTIYINYQGKRYTYSVTGSKIVDPNDAQSLVTGTTKPTVTLITCTPAGTALHRLLVTATQVSPDPSVAAAAPKKAPSPSTPAKIPGNGPT